MEELKRMGGGGEGKKVKWQFFKYFYINKMYTGPYPKQMMIHSLS